MVVFGRRKIERAGNILFHGELDQCQEHVKGLNYSDYDELSICEDNGTIKEKLIIYGSPAPGHMRNT